MFKKGDHCNGISLAHAQKKSAPGHQIFPLPFIIMLCRIERIHLMRSHLYETLTVLSLLIQPVNSFTVLET